MTNVYYLAGYISTFRSMFLWSRSSMHKIDIIVTSLTTFFSHLHQNWKIYNDGNRLSYLLPYTPRNDLLIFFVICNIGYAKNNIGPKLEIRTITFKITCLVKVKIIFPELNL